MPPKPKRRPKPACPPVTRKESLAEKGVRAAQKTLAEIIRKSES